MLARFFKCIFVALLFVCLGIFLGQLGGGADPVPDAGAGVYIPDAEGNRYQIAGAGTRLYQCDTVTGEIWWVKAAYSGGSRERVVGAVSEEKDPRSNIGINAQ
jgi:hypothetical protein